MNVSYKINNILTNKCTRAIGNSKPARTSSYDGNVQFTINPSELKHINCQVTLQSSIMIKFVILKHIRTKSSHER